MPIRGFRKSPSNVEMLATILVGCLNTLISAAVLHGLNDRAADARLLQGNDCLRGCVEIPAMRPYFVADQRVLDAVLNHVHDIAIRDGPGLTLAQVLLVCGLVLRGVALLFFILGIADQATGSQPGNRANCRPRAGAAQLFADDRPQGSTTGGPDDCSLLSIIHVRTTQA